MNKNVKEQGLEEPHQLNGSEKSAYRLKKKVLTVMVKKLLTGPWQKLLTGLRKKLLTA